MANAVKTYRSAFTIRARQVDTWETVVTQRGPITASPGSYVYETGDGSVIVAEQEDFELGWVEVPDAEVPDDAPPPAPPVAVPTTPAEPVPVPAPDVPPVSIPEPSPDVPTDVPTPQEPTPVPSSSEPTPVDPTSPPVTGDTSVPTDSSPSAPVGSVPTTDQPSEAS